MKIGEGLFLADQHQIKISVCFTWQHQEIEIVLQYKKGF